MSERERWIVYPLLFFALGAGLRDKLLQRVESKEVICESLTIIDQDQPLVPLAEIGSKQTAKNNRLDTTTYLRVNEVLCEGVHIADRKNPALHEYSLSLTTMRLRTTFPWGAAPTNAADR